MEENFNPAVGFVTRNAYRRFSQNLDFAPRPDNHPYIRQLTFSGAVTVQTDLENDVLQRGVEATLLQVNTHSQDNFGVIAANRYERLDEPFELTDDIILPTGASYTFNRVRFWGQTANRRKLAINGRYEVGDFYSGTRTERQANLSIRVRPGLFLYINGQWNRYQAGGRGNSARSSTGSPARRSSHPSWRWSTASSTTRRAP